MILAEASDAVIIGFQVRPSSDARKAADDQGIEIRLYSVIYDAINDVKDGIEGMLEPIKKEEITGTADVKQTFKISKVGTIAGCLVTDGKMARSRRLLIAGSFATASWSILANLLPLSEAKMMRRKFLPAWNAESASTSSTI